MVEAIEKAGTLTKDKLQAGDVLLCRVPEESGYVRFMQIFKFLADLKTHDFDFSKLDLEEHIDLIDFSIALFDQNHYSHAAYYDGAEILEESLDTNPETGQSQGIVKTPLEEYRPYPSDVFRYKNDAGVVVGEGLSAEPLNKSAYAIYDRIVGRPYGFENVKVLIALCINRMSQGYVLDYLEEALVERIGLWIKPIFEAEKTKIGKWLDALVRHVFYDDFSSEEMVCSQYVAAVFNEAADGKAYKVTKPSHVKTAPRKSANTITETVTHSLSIDKMTADISDILAEMPNPAANDELRSLELVMELKQIDTMYTPADFANSPNMISLGLLEFPVGEK